MLCKLELSMRIVELQLLRVVQQHLDIKSEQRLDLSPQACDGLSRPSPQRAQLAAPQEHAATVSLILWAHHPDEAVGPGCLRDDEPANFIGNAIPEGKGGDVGIVLGGDYTSELGRRRPCLVHKARGLLPHRATGGAP